LRTNSGALRDLDRKGRWQLFAYVPDSPGCVATGGTAKDAEREIREAIRFHIDGLKQNGSPVPKPTSIADYVEA
jgi:predicted RNase H-like HicB family nuclease